MLAEFVTKKTQNAMTTNQKICKVNVSENIVAIANLIRNSISGGKAGSELIAWCEANQDKLNNCGFHNYNCALGQVDFDNKLEVEFDALLDIVQALKLH